MLFQRKKNKMNGKKQKIDRKEKERNRSLWGLGSLSSPMGKASEKFSGKVSFCIFFLRKASLAVETALVLPIFFLGMVTLISFMDIYKIQTEHLQALCEKTKEAGMYAYVLNEKGPEKITLPDVYSYTPPGGIIGLPKIWMYNTVTVHAWTGADIKNFSQEKEETEKMVYVTDSGTVYHRDPVCRLLLEKLNQVPGTRVSSMRNAYGEKYAPCEICSKNQSPAGSVYITENGNRYHNLETCSGLKRNVKLVKYSDVRGRKACSRCG